MKQPVRIRKLIPLLLLSVCCGPGVYAGVYAGDGGETPLSARIARPLLDQLREQALDHGRVRVIVGLNVAFTAEGRLPNQAAVNAQRNAIRTRREALMRGLIGQEVGVTGEFQTIPYVALEVNANALNGLLRSPHVVSLEEDKLLAPTLNSSVPLINAPGAWSVGYTGAGQTVAILDTGVDSSHASFTTGGNKVVSEACYSSNFSNGIYTAVSVCPGGVDESVASGSGIDCVSAATGYSSAQSACTHGTHVAGIAAGNDGGAYIGVARDAQLISIQVFSLFTQGVSPPNMLSFSADQIKGLERVYALKDSYNIAAVNMSLGGGKYTDQASCDSANGSMKTVIDNLRSVGIATVIASANDGYVDAIASPGCISSAISVGATTDADAVASFSNVADFLDLLAPGQYIYAPVPGGFATKHGTSMAAPHVAGTWALLKHTNPGMTVDDALNALLFTGVAVDDQRSNGVITGMRRIDAGAAVNFATPGVPGVIAGPASGLVTSESGGSAQVSYVLKTQPTADVTINLSTSDAGEAGVAPGFLIFTPLNWDQAQTATLTGLDDALDDGDVVYRLLVDSVSSADADYNGITVAEVWAKNLNDDFSGVSVNAAANLSTTEAGASVNLDVVLDVIPGADVTVNVSSSDPGEGTASPASLLFTPANWDQPQTVTVSGVDDSDYDGHVVYKILLTSSSSDGNYNLSNAAALAIENRDDDASCAVYTSSDVPKVISDAAIVSVNSTLTISGAPRIGDINLIDLTGKHSWLGDLVFQLTSPAGTTVNLISESCGWTADFNLNLDDEAAGEPGGWPCPPIDGGGYVPEAALSAFDGELPNGTWTLTINDVYEFDGGSLDAWGLQVCSAPGVAISPRTGLRSTEAGAGASFSAVLYSQPAADVTLNFVSSNTSEGVPSPDSVTFTPTDWDQPQTVSVVGVDDGVRDGDVYYNILDGVAVSADAAYNGVPVPGVSLFNEDDEMSCAIYPSSDVPKLISADSAVSVTSSLTLTGAGRIGDINVVNLHGTHTYLSDLEFVLSSPLGTQVSFIDLFCGSEDNFNLSLDDQAPGEAGGWPCPPVDGGIYKPNNALSEFNGENADGVWTLSVIDYFNLDGGSLDGWGLRICATPGVSITPGSGLSTSEAGGTATFSLVLDSPPKAAVSVAVASSDLSEATLTPASVSFDTGNWYLPRSVTVSGADDFVDDGDVTYTIVTQAAQSTDANYNGLDPVDLTGNNLDDDTAGISLTAAAGLTTSEAGTSVGFNIVLESEPLAKVSIALSSSDASEGTVSPASLTFTPANWNSSQSITVTGVDDALIDGNVEYTLITAPTLSDDAKYSAIDLADPLLLNLNDDGAGAEDLNLDGNFDALDLGVMMSQWGGGPGSTADLNHDGKVDNQDMAILLEAMRE